MVPPLAPAVAQIPYERHFYVAIKLSRCEENLDFAERHIHVAKGHFWIDGMAATVTFGAKRTKLMRSGSTSPRGAALLRGITSQ